ncbi:MAG: hypothetical protein GF333_01920 [Candidatus Omnitrophica bacterium]|nr:hypothetical protein [Candidatus Omnitrophota bacterium]
MEKFARLSFIDFFFLIVCIRLLWNAFRDGVVLESISLAGLLVQTILSFHFYPVLTQRILAKAEFIPRQLCEGISFAVLFFGIGVLFFFIRKAAAVGRRKDQRPWGQRFAGAGIGAVRGSIVVSVFLFLFSLFSFPERSFAGSRLWLKEIAPVLYAVAGQGIRIWDESFELNPKVASYSSVVKQAQGEKGE